MITHNIMFYYIAQDTLLHIILCIIIYLIIHYYISYYLIIYCLKLVNIIKHYIYIKSNVYFF